MIDCENIIIHNNEAVNNILKVTMDKAYYNEIDPYAAEWLRNLITAGHIAPGEVDTRSIVDVKPNDLARFNQCHFFAGIGVWSYALRRAGWPDSRSVWTGSCPCQPFSSAGQGNGFSDERHLWPAWFHLISQRNPDVIFGEQVASKDADAWIDLVHADLEALGYAFGAIPFPSAGIGAPHIRDRLYWVGHASGTGLAQRERIAGVSGGTPGANTGQAFERAGIYLGGMANHHSDGCQQGGEGGEAMGHGKAAGADCGASRPIPTNGFWRDADWLGCRDGKWRPVEPGTFPLAHGTPARVVRLRAYGNAINAKAAQAFIECVMQYSQD